MNFERQLYTKVKIITSLDTVNDQFREGPPDQIQRAGALLSLSEGFCLGESGHDPERKC